MWARQVYRNLLISLSLFAFLGTASYLFAATRGIQVVSKKGHAVYLYKDYYALVVGVGDYTQGWPDLPGAIKDAREVAASLQKMGFAVKLVLKGLWFFGTKNKNKNTNTNRLLWNNSNKNQKI